MFSFYAEKYKRIHTIYIRIERKTEFMCTSLVDTVFFFFLQFPHKKFLKIKWL